MKIKGWPFAQRWHGSELAGVKNKGHIDRRSMTTWIERLNARVRFWLRMIGLEIGDGG